MSLSKGVPPAGSGCQPAASAAEVASSQSGIPNAVGLSRTRLAELLYEHEGFVDHDGGFHAPDRDVPMWIERSLTEPHCGDCTRECQPCLTCHAKWALEQWDEFAAMIVRAASVDTHPEGGDAVAAPFMGSAVAVEDGQTPNLSPKVKS